MLPTNETKEKTPERAQKPDLTPIKLQYPIGFEKDMVYEVTVRPPRAKDLKKYNVKALTQEYLETTEGQLNLAFACLPDLADAYKEDLSLPDILAIIERAASFL